MSFNVYYRTNVCAHCGRGDDQEDRNTTYNLARLYAWSLGHDNDQRPWGLRWLDGKTGADTVEPLRAAALKLEQAEHAEIADMLPANGWGTQATAIDFMRWALRQVETEPNGEWSVR